MSPVYIRQTYYTENSIEFFYINSIQGSSFAFICCNNNIGLYTIVIKFCCRLRSEIQNQIAALPVERPNNIDFFIL